MLQATRRIVKDYPEFGELLAEFENRISYLENSQPYSRLEEEPSPTPTTDRLSNKERDVIASLRAMVLHIEKKLNEYIDASKKRKRGTY
ncbi:hypothetical protein LCGC14_0416980 [marine sediment metagenome]|uniref:Uncharacterized protein n=1 Tax=marine sediment metagenome TaxID=412755 RepID=A0A0F9SY53_9ZZZZ